MPWSRRSPAAAPTPALAALGVLNSHVFDYLAHQQVVLNLNLFILRNLRVPRKLSWQSFLSHAGAPAGSDWREFRAALV